MTLFIDASALVAIIAFEPDGETLSDVVRADGDILWSAMSCWETVLALHKSHGYPLESARAEVEATAAVMPFRLVSIDEPVRREAFDAYHRFGKGRHRARLNMGDCFAYACAKTNDARLLYKGDDFAHTDVG